MSEKKLMCPTSPECALPEEFGRLRRDWEIREEEANKQRKEYRDKQDEMCETLNSVHLGMYGNEENKISGIIDIMKYKSELKLMRWIKKTSIGIFVTAVAIYLGVKISKLFGVG